LLTLESPETTGAWVDRRWTGIIDVLVAGLGGAVRWRPDSVVLQLPGQPHVGRVADLDLLHLCLGWAGLPVMFDVSLATLPDVPLAEFLRKLVESGLMVDDGPLAA
jgi:hypothetical protein